MDQPTTHRTELGETLRLRTRLTRLLPAAAAVLATAAATLPATAAPPPAAGARHPSAGGLSATIRYTGYGIPHILAKDYADLGFGTGWAQAADQVCVLADGFVTVRGERSRHFGPDAATDGSMSSARTNLSSDLYFTGVRDARTVERLLARPAPAGPSREQKELMRGWAAGYNAWLKENEVTDPACAGRAWVRPVSALDVARRAHALAVAGGEGALADAITAARPPAPGSAPGPEADPDEVAGAVRELFAERNATMGSNAVAFAGATTANGRGLLLGNPHYPWHGGRRFWQSQQTIPGELNVQGASLLGSPLVQIGFTADVAWSHTVATGRTANLHQLALDPADPTAYLVDGRSEPMVRRTVTVPVADGEPVTRTQWWTRYGPVVTSFGGDPLPWTATTAYALHDPNAENLRMVDSSLGLAKARSTREVAAALRRTQGLPWVNTVASDRHGGTLFTQAQVVPRITDELAERCSTPLGRTVYPATGFAVLDGSRGDCALGRDPGAVQPGIMGPDRWPLLQDAPYAENSNDSAWLANADRPLTGYERVFGDTGTARSLRTRGAVEDVAAMAGRGGLTVADLQEQQFANRVPAADLTADDVVRACPAVLPDDAEACGALARWDRRMDTGSRGALLFDRFWARLQRGTTDAERWKVPFSAADPVGTPRGLDTGAPGFATALRGAVAELRAAGIPLDAPLGEHQFVVRGGRRIPVHGGTGTGVWNMTVPVWNAAGGGYTEVRHGTSHVQAVGWDEGRCPVARTLLAYSQSSDPGSPHHADQTLLYSRERWVTARFCEGDILRDPALRVVRVAQ
ncbi:penicillin acylase family protein [Streptomyces somaliensis DSM 40738]|uniref:penicillin acylase family protein n=1 Tax=Streptomyces somaliensis TaxID=78355 RepID=UPI0021C328D9|nr:penicillin acylase family protein [Streptomyces somaliensis]MCQ0021548.1 penicillin acylase family protein [Streptomyces somaliensis DSM 40738]